MALALETREWGLLVLRLVPFVHRQSVEFHLMPVADAPSYRLHRKAQQVLHFRRVRRFERGIESKLQSS